MANQDEQLESIDLNQLDGVTGGVTTQADSSNTLMSAMGEILQSIQTLAANRQSSGGSSEQMMMMMMMMGMGNHQSSAPAQAEVPVGQVTPDGWTRVR